MDLDLRTPAPRSISTNNNNSDHAAIKTTPYRPSSFHDIRSQQQLNAFPDLALRTPCISAKPGSRIISPVKFGKKARTNYFNIQPSFNGGGGNDIGIIMGDHHFFRQETAANEEQQDHAFSKMHQGFDLSNICRDLSSEFDAEENYNNSDGDDDDATMNVTTITGKE